MSTYLNVRSWNRRQQYEFFRTFEQPFFNVCAMVEVTRLRRYCAAAGRSFSLAALYCAIHVANQLEPFRYRLRDEGVLVHPRLDIGSTLMMPDGETMMFAYFEYHASFDQFYRHAEARRTAVLQGSVFDPADERDDLIHHSVLPWMHFTSFMHARRQRHNDAVPKIVFGRYREDQGRTLLPLSVEVHHAMMDGLHVGRYFEQFEALGMAPDWV